MFSVTAKMDTYLYIQLSFVSFDAASLANFTWVTEASFKRTLQNK